MLPSYLLRFPGIGFALLFERRRAVGKPLMIGFPLFAFVAPDS
jgi:hypothetical protein